MYFQVLDKVRRNKKKTSPTKHPFTLYKKVMRRGIYSYSIQCVQQYTYINVDVKATRLNTLFQSAPKNLESDYVLQGEW